MDTEIGKFSRTSQSQIKWISTSPEQRLALAPNLIPFLEHDDRNRVLIGANILRQALPTLNISTPRISSELDIYARNDSSQTLQSRWFGLVTYVVPFEFFDRG